VTPNYSKRLQFAYILRCLVAGIRKDFGIWVEYSKSHPIDNKPSLKWATGRGHVT